MNGDFDLNSPNNLNPIVNPAYRPLPQSNAPIENTPVSQSNVIRWNEEVKRKGIKNIKAINTDESIDINKKKLGFIKILSIFGVLALVIIAVVAGYWGYTVYKGGSSNPINLVCGNATITVPDCTLTAPPDTCINNCNLTIGNFTSPGNFTSTNINFTCVCPVHPACPACPANPDCNCNPIINCNSSSNEPV